MRHLIRRSVNVFLILLIMCSAVYAATNTCIEFGSEAPVECVDSSVGGDSLSIDGSAVVNPDFVSTGQIDFIDTSNTVTANINDDTILEADLKAVNAAVDEDILSYEATTGDYEWHTPAELITDGTNITWSGTTLNVDDAFLINNGNDTTSGVITAAGFTIGAAAILEAELEILDGLTATTAEIETLTDASNADSLHVHASAGVSSLVDADMANDALDADKIVGDSTDDDDLDVSAGGTGVSSLTEGGILMGQGTGDIETLGVMSDGEVIVGDGTTDPVLESGATLRTSIGLGTTDDVEFKDLIVEGTFDLGTVATFTDSDTTPDVSAAAYWNTNTTGVTILDFDGAGISDGQVITVFSKGAIVYDVDGGLLRAGSTDITTASGDVTVWQYDGTDWVLLAFMDDSENVAGASEVNDLETTDPPNVADTEIYIGTGSGTGAWASISGDATMSNSGVLTVGTDALNATEIEDIYVLLAGDSMTGDLTITGTTPLLTIGDGGAEDSQINFDGNAQDWHIGLQDTTDDFIIGLGTVLGTTAHMIFNQDGIITKPLQPAFLVTPTSAQNNIAVGSDVTIVLGTEIFDLNSDFASNTFTAPVTGKYAFLANFRLDQIDSTSTTLSIQIVTSNRSYFYIIDTDVMFSSDPTASNWFMGTLADMDSGDTAHMAINQSSGNAQMDVREGIQQSFFAGFLVL